MRADAVRNRKQVMAAARELVGLHGADIAMAALAERAGVAVGTLYRHFPTKQDLVAAVVTESVRDVADLAESTLARISSGAEPGAEMLDVFQAIARRSAGDRAVKQAAAAVGLPPQQAETAGPDDPVGRATAALSAVVQAAVSAGSVDPNLTLDDLVMLLTQVPDTEDARAQRRYVDVVVAGLRRG